MKRLKEREPTVEQAVNRLRTVLKPKCFKFMKSQVRLATKRRYLMSEKAQAVSFHSISPKAYRMMSDIFIMPSVTTIKDLLRSLQFAPGFSDFIFEALKVTCTDWRQMDRICSVAVD